MIFGRWRTSYGGLATQGAMRSGEVGKVPVQYTKYLLLNG
jgi:hypothetical protein